MGKCKAVGLRPALAVEPGAVTSSPGVICILLKEGAKISPPGVFQAPDEGPWEEQDFTEHSQPACGSQQGVHGSPPAPPKAWRTAVCRSFLLSHVCCL